jgi:hypothetical protein
MYIFIIRVCYSAPYRYVNYRWTEGILPGVHLDRMKYLFNTFLLPNDS